MVSEKTRSLCLKPHGVHGGLPCSQCGNTTHLRQYNPKQEPSPYNSYKHKPKVDLDAPVRVLYLDKGDLEWDGPEED
jgi:hypothetical protein